MIHKVTNCNVFQVMHSLWSEFKWIMDRYNQVVELSQSLNQEQKRRVFELLTRVTLVAPQLRNAIPYIWDSRLLINCICGHEAFEGQPFTEPSMGDFGRRRSVLFLPDVDVKITTENPNKLGRLDYLKMKHFVHWGTLLGIDEVAPDYGLGGHPLVQMAERAFSFLGKKMDIDLNASALEEHIEDLKRKPGTYWIVSSIMIPDEEMKFSKEFAELPQPLKLYLSLPEISLEYWRDSDLCSHPVMMQTKAQIHFLQERICAVESLKIPKKTRKWLRGSSVFDSRPVWEAKVVTLRRSYQEALRDPESTSSEVNWSCRWLVSGHWRRQYYPSNHRHRVIWIDPYIKGPDDKPLKDPDKTIYRVIR